MFLLVHLSSFVAGRDRCKALAGLRPPIAGARGTSDSTAPHVWWFLQPKKSSCFPRPMAKRLKFFWDYMTFSRENKPFKRHIFQGPKWLSEKMTPPRKIKSPKGPSSMMVGKKNHFNALGSVIPSLKLTFSPLKMLGFLIGISFSRGLFSGANC